MERVYYHKSVSKNYNKPVDHFLFPLAVLFQHVRHLLFLRGD